MCPQGLVQPRNAILYAGEPIVQEMEITTEADCYPGRLVMSDALEYGVKVCTSGATTCLGVLDVKPGELRTTEYDDDDQARVLRGDIVVLLTASSGYAIEIGDRLVPGNAGTVIKTHIASGATVVVGYALQSGAAWVESKILVKLMI